MSEETAMKVNGMAVALVGDMNLCPLSLTLSLRPAKERKD